MNERHSISDINFEASLTFKLQKESNHEHCNSTISFPTKILNSKDIYLLLESKRICSWKMSEICEEKNKTEMKNRAIPE